MTPEQKKFFNIGFIVCLSNMEHGDGAEECFEAIGSPSAKDVYKLGLGEYDRESMNRIRKAVRK